MLSVRTAQNWIMVTALELSGIEIHNPFKLEKVKEQATAKIYHMETRGNTHESFTNEVLGGRSSFS